MIGSLLNKVVVFGDWVICGYCYDGSVWFFSIVGGFFFGFYFVIFVDIVKYVVNFVGNVCSVMYILFCYVFCVKVSFVF